MAWHFTDDVLHPPRQRAETFDQVLVNRWAVCRVGYQLRQSTQDAVVVGVQGVFEPMQGLHDPHRGSPCPIEAARRRKFELDHQPVELDGATPGVGVDCDACRHSIGQTEVIGGGHAVDQQAQLVSSGNGIDNYPVVGCGRPLRQPVDGRAVIEPSVNTAQFARGHHALEGFIDGITGAEMREISRHPDGTRARGGN